MWIINWSDNAQNEYYNILNFWNNRNGNSTYATKILLEVENTEGLLIENPFIGHEIEINFKKIYRVIILKHFSMIYRITETIEIIAFWDNRNNPKKLKV